MRARRGLIGPDEEASIRRQCELLGVSRSSVYYEPVEPDAEELELMRRIDELHLEFPFYGSRSIAREIGKNAEVDPVFWTRGLGGISGLLFLEGSRNHGEADATES